MEDTQSKLNVELADDLDAAFSISQGVKAIDTDTGRTPEVDPEAEWVEIWIDEVEGLSNYEVVQGNGVLYQILRGTPVKVPPIVVEILKLAIKSTFKMIPHPTILGKETLHEIISSSIPWRKV